MSTRSTDLADRPTDSDRRTFLKRVGLVAPLGHLGRHPLVDGAPATEVGQSTDDAWPMITFDPASTNFNPDATGLDQPPDVKWRVSDFPSSEVWPAAVVGDTAYVGSAFPAYVGGPSNIPPAGDLRAVSTDTGTLRWLFVPSEPGVGAPAVVDGTIYITGADGNVNAVDVTTKRLRWTFEAEGMTMFPKVTAETVYVPDSMFNVYAINVATGEERWRFTQPTAPVPFSVAVANETVYVGSIDTNVYAVDAASGEEQWRFEGSTEPVAPPAVAHETVYVASDTNVYALDATTGEEKWRFSEVTTPFGPLPLGIPAVDDNTVYVANQDTVLYAIDATTGDQRWQFEAATERLSVPSVGGNTVYVGSFDTNLYAIDATTGEERWRFEEIPDPLDAPIVVRDALYVATFPTRRVYAVA